MRHVGKKLSVDLVELFRIQCDLTNAISAGFLNTTLGYLRTTQQPLRSNGQADSRPEMMIPEQSYKTLSFPILCMYTIVYKLVFARRGCRHLGGNRCSDVTDHG